MAASMFTSSRLIYRAIEESDSDFLYQLQLDPESQLNVTAAFPTPQAKSSVKEQYAYFATCTLSAVIWKKPTTEREHPERVGIVLLKDPNDPDTRQFGHRKLGINILRKHQGRGYGSEALQWLLQWSFRWAGLRKVSLWVYDYNIGAVKLYEKLGFVMEGRLRDEVWYDGRWRDCLVYSMLKGEWEEKYGGGKAVEGT